MKGLLKSVIHTLNQIEVRGEKNLDMMLGCIQTMSKLVEACEVKITESEEKIDDHPNEQGD